MAAPAESGEVPDSRGWGRLALATVVAGQSMAFGLAVSLTPPEGTTRWVLHGLLATGAIVVFLLLGGPILTQSFSAARAGRIVYEQLFLLGILGAFGASVYSTLSGHGSVYYEVVAILLAIYTLGTLLGEKRKRQVAGAALRLDRAFARCNRVDPVTHGESMVPAAEIVSGDLVRVRCGEGVAVDGEVLEGSAYVQEAAMTGEPFPVVKRGGDEIFAGSRLIEDTLLIRATRSGRERRLDGLLDAVHHARQSPSELQTQVDRLTSWFLPLVAFVALGTFVGWGLAGQWESAIFNALAVLLVACPCAMGLATPIGVWSALAAMARRGLVARSGEFVERLAQVEVAAFDKTGTLGEESLGLVDFVVADGVDRAGLMREIAAVQAVTSHPVAVAFHGWDRGGADAKNVRAISGIGVAGDVAGNRIEIGNSGLAGVADQATLGALRATASNLPFSHEVMVRRNGSVLAIGRLRERMRAGALSGLSEVRGLGVETCVWTGDRAEHAAMHGLEGVSAGLAPEDKRTLVQNFQNAGKRVLFVGDGINDSPALAAAHASIAVGGAAELAADSAGARLYGNRIETIAYALSVARATTRVIRQNLIFAATYNTVGMALAAAGLLHPVAAALIMLAASSTVVWRALREAGRLDPEGDFVQQPEKNIDMQKAEEAGSTPMPALQGGGGLA